MAIQWGKYSGYARLGVEFVRTSQASTSEVWRMDVYLGLTGWVADNYNALKVTGSFSYSGSVPVNAGAVSALKLYSASKTFSRPIGRTSPGRVSVSLTEFAAGSPTVSASFTVSGQPYQAPALPGGVGARLWLSAQTVTVSFRQNATELRPVSGFDIRQQIWPSTSTTLVGQPGAASTSWTSGVFPAGGEHRFLVRQRGPGGTSAWVYTSWVQTTPRAPANVVAERVTGQIQVSWVGLSEYQDSTFELYQGAQLVASGITGSSYTVASPPAGNVVYTVRERNSSGVLGPGTDSNPINVLAPPYAPSNLQPNGGYAPSGENLQVRWEHEPSDGSAQTQYTVRFRTSPEGQYPSWHEVSGLTAQNRILTWATLGAGTQWAEWQVRTKGEHADYGPYSPVARVDFAPRPTVQITAPTTTIPADSTTVTITAGDTSREYSWRAEAYLDGVLHASRSGYGKPPYTWTLTGLPNGTSLRVDAVVTAEVDSLTASRTVAVTYAAPLTPELEPSWISETGAVSLAVTNPSGGTVPAVSNRLERRTPDGVWEVVAESVPLNGTLTDPVPPLDDRIEYRAVSVAATGASGYGQPVTPTGRLVQAHYLNWGANLENSVRIRYNPDWQTAPGLSNQRLVHFAGQTVPTVLMGRETNVARQIGGILLDEGELTARDQFERLYEVALTATLVTLRAPESGPVSGMISGVSTGHEVWGGIAVSLSHTRAK